MARNKFGSKKSGVNGTTAGPGNQRKSPLAEAMARNLAGKGLAQSPSFDQIDRDLEEKEQRCAIAFWKCFNLNSILVKCIYKKEEERVHDE